MSDPTQTRGFKNHNPLDIEDFGIKWDGIAGHDGPYLKFVDDFHGLRAGAIDLLHAQKLHGRKTVRDIITAYAPEDGVGATGGAETNPTEAYIRNVSVYLGVNDDAIIDLTNKCMLRKMLEACIRQEIGGLPYDRDLLQRAADAAIAHG